jgi:hypothetical protein
MYYLEPTYKHVSKRVMGSRKYISMSTRRGYGFLIHTSHTNTQQDAQTKEYMAVRQAALSVLCYH